MTIRIGVDAVVVRTLADGLEIESRTRLAPGRPVDIAVAGQSRRAMVSSWCLVSMGSDGAWYRGRCLWESSRRAGDTRLDDRAPANAVPRS